MPITMDLNEKNKYDYVVVGAGIVGLTVAYEIKNRIPNASIAILEKETCCGVHASGRNSGVLHCGIYYPSGTMKAAVCSAGAKAMADFANDNNIGYKKTGKVIVATNEDQLVAIENLIANAKASGIKAWKINNSELKEIEPFCAESTGAVYCPDTAVVDGKGILKALQKRLESAGVKILFNSELVRLAGKNSILTRSGNIEYGYLVNCAGAYSDKVAKLFGASNKYELLPFKGIYWRLTDSASSLVNSNIYPVPDPKLPFLGMHFTKTIDGTAYIGPTAMPSMGRENYSGVDGLSMRESAEVLYRLVRMLINDKGCRDLASAELKKYIKSNFFFAAKALVPSLAMDDMVRTPKVGIRPQLVNIETNKLEMDFVLESVGNTIHVLNAISPAFTGSFAFATHVVDRIFQEQNC